MKSKPSNMQRTNQLFCPHHLSVHQCCHLFPLPFRASSPLLLCLQVVFHLYRLSAHTSGSAGNEVTHQQMHTWMDLHRCALVASSCPCSINNGLFLSTGKERKILLAHSAVQSSSLPNVKVLDKHQ